MQSPINNEVRNTEPLYEPPRVVLIEEKQWQSLRKRYHMTPRELQVARLVCRGLNNKQIADVVRIQQGTVKTHLRNIYRRVRVKSKIALLLRFIEDTGRLAAKPEITRGGIPISQVPPRTDLTGDPARKIEQQ